VQTNAKTVVLALVAITSSVSQLRAQKLDPSLYSSLEWRMIGPFRGGRTLTGATGVRGQPNVFYVGVNNGGVLEDNRRGRVWTPIFDDQPTGSVGDVASCSVEPQRDLRSGRGRSPAPRSPLELASHKSTDAGKTWRHLGLRDGQRDRLSHR
jgi:hypothetical protein